MVLADLWMGWVSAIVISDMVCRVPLGALVCAWLLELVSPKGRMDLGTSRESPRCLT